MSQDALVALGRDHLYPNYRQPPFVIARGEGSRLWDASGKQYFDLFAGIAVSTALYSFQRSALTAPPVGVPSLDDLVRIRGISNTQFGVEGRGFSTEEIQGFIALDGIFPSPT